jgi:hypothetical protein
MTTIFPLWLIILISIIVLCGAWLCWAMRTRTSYGDREAHINTPLGLVVTDVCWAWSDKKFIASARKKGVRGTLKATGAYMWIAPEMIRAVSFR